jgi:hypothetical protein
MAYILVETKKCSPLRSFSGYGLALRQDEWRSRAVPPAERPDGFIISLLANPVFIIDLPSEMSRKKPAFF